MCRECVVSVSHVNTCLSCQRVPTLEQAREARSGYSIHITLHVDTPRPDVLPPPATAPLSQIRTPHTPPQISRTTPHTTTTRPSHSAPMPLHSQHHLESTSPGGGGGGGKGPVGWVVEVDGPSHSRERERDYQQHPWGRATGSTQLKRRHLQSLGLALVRYRIGSGMSRQPRGNKRVKPISRCPTKPPFFLPQFFLLSFLCAQKHSLPN